MTELEARAFQLAQIAAILEAGDRSNTEGCILIVEHYATRALELLNASARLVSVPLGSAEPTPPSPMPSPAIRTVARVVVGLIESIDYAKDLEKLIEPGDREVLYYLAGKERGK